ncbi:MAG: hypothetical protein IT370_35540 [Deltaproteobacteria bacterium]|nr:hypothetical protein [Deltaproteobacteria bacterium]
MIVLLAVAGCVGAEPEAQPLPVVGGVAAFVVTAQPVLTARCANPSCHGNAARPLSLFAVHRHRMDSADTFLDAPLTGAEERHNFLQASAFLLGVDRAAHSLLLTQPLAVRAGGDGHAGVEVFADTEDFDYRRLRAWAATALGEEEGP